MALTYQAPLPSGTGSGAIICATCSQPYGKIHTGQNTVVNIIWLGDSIAQIGNVYNPLNGLLKSMLGDAGPGFLRFDFTNAVFGTAQSTTGTWVKASKTAEVEFWPIAL